jgi:hypothetical protein
MATFGTDFDEFTAGSASTNLTGFTVQDIGVWTSTITDIGSGDHVLRHSAGAGGADVGLVTYDAFETTGALEAVVKVTLGTTSDAGAQMGPALIAADGRCYAWRAAAAATSTTWRLALFTAAGSISESVGSAISFTEPTAGTPFWMLIGRDTSGNIYGSLWLDGNSRPGSPMVSVNPTTDLTTVKPGMTSFDQSDDPIDFHWFGAATDPDTAPETASGPGAITGTGALTTAVATMSGSGVLRHSASGALVVTAATTAATGAVHHTGSGALTVSTAVIVGGGSVNGVSNGVDAAGDLTAATSTVAAAGKRGSRDVPGAVDLTVSAATVSGTATVGQSEESTGTGALSSPPPTLTAAAVLRHSATGAVASNKPTVASSAVVRHTASGALTVRSAIVVGGNVVHGAGLRGRIGLGVGL